MKVSQGFRISIPVALVVTLFLVAPSNLKPAIATEGAPQGGPQESDECRELRERCEILQDIANNDREVADEACGSYHDLCTFGGGGIHGWLASFRSACKDLKKICDDASEQADASQQAANEACAEWSSRCGR